MISNSAAKRDVESLVHPYTNLSLHLTKGPRILGRGKGIYVFDDQGKEYIEGLAGLWCTSLGFAEEELIAAAVEQMRRLPYYHNFAHKSTEPMIDLAEKLKEIAPGTFSKVFYTCSGSEANDTQIKLLWYYNNAIGRPKKKKIISRIKAYHGVTVAAASLTGLPANHRDFDLPLPQVKHAALPHYYRGAEPGETEEEFASRLAEDLDELIQHEDPDTVAGFIAEPVMGAGGVIVPPATYFEKVQAVLKKYDIRFIDDEVICGFGRTANMWGAETFRIEANSISCAKALTSAYLPLGAVLIQEDMWQAMLDESRKIGTFGHGFTYGGHPVCAAVGLKTIELMQRRNLIEHVRDIAPHFQRRLKAFADHPLVGETRGVGLIGAIELVADKKTKKSFDPTQAVGAYCAGRAEAHGLIIRPLVDSMAFCPPLIIENDEIDAMFESFAKALDETEAWVSKEGLRAAA